jgi:hypothetical protein
MQASTRPRNPVRAAGGGGNSWRVSGQRADGLGRCRRRRPHGGSQEPAGGLLGSGRAQRRPVTAYGAINRIHEVINSPNEERRQGGSRK